MSSTLHIREAREDDLPTMTRISIEAFRGRPMNEAKFPPHLRILPGDEDKVGPVTERRRARLGRPNVHTLVVVDEADHVLGAAEWQSVPEPLVPVLTPEAREARFAELPSCVDRAAIEALERDGLLLDQTIRDALGEEGYDNSWCELGSPVSEWCLSLRGNLVWKDC